MLVYTPVNSLRQRDAYMRRETNHLLIMACGLTVPSHYLNQWWSIVNWTLRNKLQWNFNRNLNIVIHENAFENVVCEMAAMLYRPQCVNCLWEVHSVRNLHWYSYRCIPSRTTSYHIICKINYTSIHIRHGCPSVDEEAPLNKKNDR